jgi:hypothetical protein
MYDIQTLFSVPDGFRSKAIVTTIRALGDNTNSLHPRHSAVKPAKADFSPPPRFASRKASATVALTSTTALRTWKPIPSASMDFSQREENAIPFPTAPAGEQPPAHHTPVVLKRPLPVEVRRRRSGALVPPSAWGSAAVVVLPVAKRPRKSKRVLADLQFMASVHRSIIALHAETQNRRHVNVGTGVGAMDVEDGSGSQDVTAARATEDLSGLDQQLVAQLADRLYAGGFASPLVDANLETNLETERSLRLPLHVPQEGTRAPPPSPEMEPGVYAMDVAPDPLPVSLGSSYTHRLPPSATMPPPPSPPPPRGNSPPPPTSPPGLVSPRVLSETPAEKRVYTMPQLVATHIMRLHERGGSRTPNLHSRAPRLCSPLRESPVW